VPEKRLERLDSVLQARDGRAVRPESKDPADPDPINAEGPPQGQALKTYRVV
jgi:hypothetical protein